MKKIFVSLFLLYTVHKVLVLLYLYAWIVPDNVSVFPEEFVKLVDVKV